MREAILAIDQGTSNTKVLLIDRMGSVIARASVSLTQSYPQPGWVEQDPTAVWRSVQGAIDDCLKDVDDVKLIAIAISNQRETVTAWDRHTGKSVGPAIGWQCRRTAPMCEGLKARQLERTLHKKTGLAIDPLFSGTKMRWLIDSLDHGPQRAEQGDLCLGTMDSWVLWNLTGGSVHACDASNASRTQMFNINRLQWDEELLEIFGVPQAVLPEVKASSAIYGTSVSSGRIPEGIPIATLIGDSHAALFGQTGFRPGTIKATYGTGSSLMTPIPNVVLSNRGLSTTIAWVRDSGQPVYAFEGNIPVTGAAVQWLGEFLGLSDPARDVADLAARGERAEGLYFVPAFVGLGAPHWDGTARGLITGLTRSTLPAHMARATLEAIAFQICDVFDVMQAEAGQTLELLQADGGASGNDQLMQLQADLLGCAVLRNKSSDISAIGAAYLAGLAVGFWSSEAEIEGLKRSYDRFEPRISDDERGALREGWEQAVARARHVS
jgi:glycerol kinase